MAEQRWVVPLLDAPDPRACPNLPPCPHGRLFHGEAAEHPARCSLCQCGMVAAVVAA